MADVIYVPKSDILDLITEEYTAGGFTDYSNYSNLWDEVDDMPAADVQPVKHGRWSECYTDSRLYSGICSVCGGAAIRSVKANPLDYCPNCGARMDGEQV